MVRSIVAVWCLALALIVIAATAGCDWGCANGDDCSAGLTQPMPDMALPAQVCSTACPVCGSGETCFHPSAGSRLPAFCGRQCADDRDCSGDAICATLVDATIAPVCISAGAPKSCVAGYNPGGTVGSWCFDTYTVAMPFEHLDDGVSGWELVHCANGCSSGACS